MYKILLDGKEVKEFVKESLPMLIHGEHGSGASLYTVSLAANFYAKGFPILFLCGYKMAEEEFMRQVGNTEIPNVQFFTQGETEEFKKTLKSSKAEHLLIVVKNIELFDEEIFDLVKDKQNIIISGNINISKCKQEILIKNFTTKIFFSPFENILLPALNKYEGFVMNGYYKGITTLHT